jgi:hypothetical protein
MLYAPMYPFQLFDEVYLPGGEAVTCRGKTQPDLNQIITVSLFPQGKRGFIIGFGVCIFQETPRQIRLASAEIGVRQCISVL